MDKPKMFKNRNEFNCCYYMFDRYPTSKDGFMKRKPYIGSVNYAQISVWHNVPPNDGLWVKINGYGNSYSIMKSEDIIKLADALKRLKKLPTKTWSGIND